MEKNSIITSEEIQEWKEEMIKAAKENLMKDGELRPVALMMMENPEKKGSTAMVTYPMSMQNDAMKDLDGTMIRLTCEKNDVFAILLMSEAWMSMIDKEEFESGEFEQASKRDNKVEIAMMNLETSEGTESNLFNIKRDEKDNIIELEERDTSEIASMNGRFSNFLKGFGGDEE